MYWRSFALQVIWSKGLKVRLLMERHWQRATVLLIVLLFHLLVLRVQWLSRVVLGNTESTSVLYLLPLPELTQQPRASVPLSNRRTRLRSQSEIAQRPAEATEVITQQPASSVPATIDIPTVDWHEEATQTAANIAKRRGVDTYRSLSSRPTSKETLSATAAQDGVFPAPLHKYGEMQRFGGGEIIRWLNDDCYETNRPPSHLDLGVFDKRSVLVCKRFKKPVRGDLFEKFKPEYLSVPMPEPPAQQQPNEVPLHSAP